MASITRTMIIAPGQWKECGDVRIVNKSTKIKRVFITISNGDQENVKTFDPIEKARNDFIASRKEAKRHDR